MLTNGKILRGAACAVALLASLAATSAAQTTDKRTVFTFSGPVAIPGVTLPAGQYIFRVPDTGGRVLQVLSGDGTKSYAMFFTIPAERLEPADKPEVRFMETPSGVPAAIRTWWYPGERRGYELVYPKDQARRLAQGASQPVLTTQAQTTTTEQTGSTDLARISSAGQESKVAANDAPTASAPAGSSQQGELASSSIVISNPNPTLAPAVANTPATATAAKSETAGTAPRSTRTTLPKTADALWLIALAGTLSIGAGAALWPRPRW